LVEVKQDLSKYFVWFQAISQVFSDRFDRILFIQNIYKRKKKHIKETEEKRKETIEGRSLILLQIHRVSKTTINSQNIQDGVGARGWEFGGIIQQ